MVYVFSDQREVSSQLGEKMCLKGVLVALFRSITTKVRLQCFILWFGSKHMQQTNLVCVKRLRIL